LNRYCTRSVTGTRRHAGNARDAAWTARSTSSAGERRRGAVRLEELLGTSRLPSPSAGGSTTGGTDRSPAHTRGQQHERDPVLRRGVTHPRSGAIIANKVGLVRRLPYVAEGSASFGALSRPLPAVPVGPSSARKMPCPRPAGQCWRCRGFPPPTRSISAPRKVHSANAEGKSGDPAGDPLRAEQDVREDEADAFRRQVNQRGGRGDPAQHVADWITGATVIAISWLSYHPARQQR